MCWCWDIGLLRCAIRGRFYRLYLIEEVFSREIVCWEIHVEQSAEHTVRLMKCTFLAEGGHHPGDSGALRLDNGSRMKGATIHLSGYRRRGVVRPPLGERRKRLRRKGGPDPDVRAGLPASSVSLPRRTHARCRQAKAMKGGRMADEQSESAESTEERGLQTGAPEAWRWVVAGASGCRLWSVGRVRNGIRNSHSG